MSVPAVCDGDYFGFVRSGCPGCLVAEYAEPARRLLISSVDRRIVIRFGDDPELMYTDHIMLMYEFLENMPDLIIFDKKRNVFIN